MVMGKDGVDRDAPRPVCPRCTLTIEPGEEMHPTATPFHVPCHKHKKCYVLCIDQHPDYIRWYEARFKRSPVQRSVG